MNRFIEIKQTAPASDFDAITSTRDEEAQQMVFNALNTEKTFKIKVEGNKKQIKRLLEHTHNDNIIFYYEKDYKENEYYYYRRSNYSLNDNLIIENNYMSTLSTIAHTFYPFNIIDYDTKYFNCLVCEKCELLYTSCVCNNAYLDTQSEFLYYKHDLNLIKSYKTHISNGRITELIIKQLTNFFKSDYIDNELNIFKVVSIRQCNNGEHHMYKSYRTIERPTYINRQYATDKSNIELIKIILELKKIIKSLHIKQIKKMIETLNNLLFDREYYNSMIYFLLNTLYNDLLTDYKEEEESDTEEESDDESTDESDDDEPPEPARHVDERHNERLLNARFNNDLFDHILTQKKINKFYYRGLLIMEDMGDFYRIIYKNSKRVSDKERFNIINKVFDILHENNLKIYFDRK